MKTGLKRMVLGMTVLAGLMAALQLLTFPAVAVRLPDQGNSLACLAVIEAGEPFSLDYRHSVEKTRVRGVFTVSENGSMKAVETRMTSVGTGLPNTFVSRTRKEGDWIIVDEQNRTLEPFRFFIQPVNQTKLTLPGMQFDLMQLPGGTIVRIGVEKVSLFEILWARWSAHLQPTHLKGKRK